MNKPKAMLIDLDGTIYSGAHPLPYAPEWIYDVRSQGIQPLFVTNNSARTPEQVADQLLTMGIAAERDEICTSAQAAAFYIKEQSFGRRVYCIGEEGLRTALVEAGMEFEEEHPEMVVQGIARNFHYDTLSAAVRSIRQGARYVLTNPDLLLPWNGGYIPGAGTIAAAIKAGSGTEPVVIGKPSPIIMNFALKVLKLDASDVWMVGDNLATDIAAGRAAGCKTALVLTGVTTPSQLQEQVKRTGVEADFVFEDLGKFRSFMMDAFA